MSSEASASHPTAIKPRARWLMLALVWLVYASFGVTVGSVAPLVEAIRADMAMTSGQMGLVLGIWQLVYIGTAPFLGTLVDRWGARKSIGLGLAIAWVSLVARGGAFDFASLSLAIAVFGVGGPIISIGIPKVVAQWFEGNERGSAAGVYTTGVLAGMAFAFATAASFVAPLTGSWRGISIVYGTITLAVQAAWWLLARDAKASAEDEGPSVSDRRVLLDLLKMRNVQVVLALSIGTFLLNHGLDNWMPTILLEKGMSAVQAGFWPAAGTATAIASLLVIPARARTGSRGPVMMVLLAVAVLSILGLAAADDVWAAPAVMGLAIVRAPLMPMLTLVLMETPGVGARRMGASAGLFFSAAEIGGFGGPFLLGALREATGTLAVGVVALSGVAAAMIMGLRFIREERPPSNRA